MPGCSKACLTKGSINPIEGKKYPLTAIFHMSLRFSLLTSGLLRRAKGRRENRNNNNNNANGNNNDNFDVNDNNNEKRIRAKIREGFKSKKKIIWHFFIVKISFVI